MHPPPAWGGLEWGSYRLRSLIYALPWFSPSTAGGWVRLLEKHPPMLLRSSPLLLREEEHPQWPGKAGFTGVAGMACSAAFGADQPPVRQAAYCTLDI